MVKYREFVFKSCTGKDLSAYAWEVDSQQGSEQPKGNIILIHGLGEHMGRYAEMAEFMVEHGFNVYGFDLLGFGNSPGRRGYVKTFDHYFQDMIRFIMMHKDGGQWQKTILVGNSMGGLLSLAFTLLNPGLVNGLAVSSPALQAFPIPGYLNKIVSLCNLLAPWLAFSNRLQVEDLCRNQQVGEDYRNDPLTHDRITPRLFKEITKTMEFTQANASKLTVPLLLMYAGADRIVDPAGAERFAQNLGADLPQEVVCYPEMYHEIWNDPEKEQIWGKIVQWFTNIVVPSA